ncbi:MAG TPA: HdeD family acid-resistance protein [Motilibacteraceae bacterium]|nr:HdeD family acid-resistance protein [Motilibacteraceae bacterium]
MVTQVPTGTTGSGAGMPRDPVLGALEDVGRHWGWLLGYGIVSVVLGIMVLAWPEATLVVLAVLFAVELFVSGIFHLVGAFTDRGVAEGSGGHRALWGVLGILSVLVGLMLLRHPLQSLAVVAFLIGIWWVVSGVTDLVTAIGGSGQPGRGWRVFMGVVSTIAGFYVVLRPGISLGILTVLAGFWLLLYGLLAVVAAFQLRSAARTLPA